MRMDSYIRNVIGKVTTSDGKYLGTEHLVLRRNVATATILSNYAKNESPELLFDQAESTLLEMAQLIRENNCIKFQLSYFKFFTIQNKEYAITQIGPRQYVFINPMFVKHLYANGFKLCFPYETTMKGLYVNKIAIMKADEVVGLVLPLQVPIEYAVQAQHLFN